MSLNRIALKYALIAGAAATVLLYVADSWRQGSSDHDWASRLAHQVLSQAEAFLLTARSESVDGKVPPLDPVIRNLTQGVDPRVVKVQKVRGTYTSLPSIVSGGSDGLYELTKILSQEGEGIRVTIQIPKTGFLGTRNLFFRDLAVLFFFVLFSAAAYAVCIEVRQAKQREVAAPAPVAQVSDEWISRQRVLLKNVGMRFKATFDHARKLAVAAASAQHNVKQLRSGLHLEIDRLRESQALSVEGLQIIDKIEAVALNLMIESGKEQPDTETIARLGEQLHPLIRQVRQTTAASQMTLRDLELQVEPWVTDADLASHAFKDVENAAKDMDAELPAAKATLIEQAKLLTDEAKRRVA